MNDEPAATIPQTVHTQRCTTVALAGIEDLGAGYVLLRFAADPPLEGVPGHFAMVRSLDWGHAPLLPRPMSLLSVGADPSLLVKVVGDGTRRMARAVLGERFYLVAPLGRPWPLPRADHRPLLVAGGVGVAPLLFLARQLAARPLPTQGARPRVVALYGGRTARDLPLAEQLEQVAELRVATEDGSRGACGRVTVLLTEALDEDRSAGRKTVIYTCGPHPMMAAVAAAAAQRGLSCFASLESLMGCGYGVCLGCPVPRSSGGYLYTCIDGPCVDARAVDWNQDVMP